MIDALGYCRISTEDQSQNSIPGQIREVTAYCKRNNINLLKIFTDNGQSAFNFQRKEWKQVEQFLKENKSVRYLVITSMDRFSRANLVDALQKMDEIQKRTNVKILTISDPVDLDLDDFGVDLRRIMELMFSNYELKKIRKRTSDGLYQSMSTGRYVGKAPFGYKNARDVNGKPILLVDEERDYLVRMIYRMYLAGMELAEVRKHVDAHGFKMKGNSAVRRILTNALYAGIIQVPARNKRPALSVKAIHPPLIPEADYWAVQSRVNSKTIRVQKREEVFLRGVLRCSECGHVMTAGNSKGRHGKYYWYYLCKDHKKNLAAKKIHEQFYKILEHLKLPDASVKVIGEKLKSMISGKMDNRTGDLMKSKLSLQKVMDRIAATEEKYLATPDISETSYKRIITGLRSDETRLREQIAAISGTAKNYYSVLNDLLPKLSNLSELFYQWPLYKQHAFINLICSRCLTHDGLIYRTPSRFFLLMDNARVLKEKGLLLIEQPSFILETTPASSRTGTPVETFSELLELQEIFAA